MGHEPVNPRPVDETAEPEVRCLVAGDWRAGSGPTFPVLEPATDELLAEVGAAGDDDVDEAVAAAVAAADDMAALGPFERAALLDAVADLLDARADALAVQLTRESGKPLGAEARPELAESADIFRLAADEIVRLGGEVLPSAEPTKRVFTFRRPLGPVAVITPWNFPLNIPAELVAAALAAGDPVVLKPSEGAPLSAGALAAAVVDAGWPAGAINLVHGDARVGSRLVSDGRLAGIAFVGGHRAAEDIVRRAGLTRTLIEASGNGPQIVCSDADVPAAAAAAVFGAHFACGQCCVATERVLVHESVHEAFVAEAARAAAGVVVGDPLDPATTLGPLHDDRVAATLTAHLDDALSRGARLVCGGGPEPDRPVERYFPVTVLDAVTPAMQVFREESFGPVVPVTVFADDAEAVELANDSELGLQAAVFTRSLGRAWSYVEQLRTGTVIVNDSVSFWETHPPFGGAGGTRSGWGRIGGRFTIEDLTDVRTAVLDVGPRALP